jgi:hypothetical protein
MTDLPSNTPGLGHNESRDFAQETTGRLTMDYAEYIRTLDSLLDEARLQPKVINSDQDALNSGAIIKRFRDLDGRVEAVRVLEKEPSLRIGNAVDGFFNALRDKIGKRNPRDRSAKPGAADILQARINDYQDRKIAEEQARLEAQRLAAERAEREARETAAREAAAAEEARLAAERARKPENRDAKAAIADEQEGRATEAQITAQRAEERAEDARFAATAKPAELARVRGHDASGGGVLLTVAKEPYATLVDRSKLDMKALWPFFTDAEIEKALRAWSKTTGFRVQMEGAEIGSRNRGVTR